VQRPDRKSAPRVALLQRQVHDRPAQISNSNLLSMIIMRAKRTQQAYPATSLGPGRARRTMRAPVSRRAFARTGKRLAQNNAHSERMGHCQPQGITAAVALSRPPSSLRKQARHRGTSHSLNDADGTTSVPGTRSAASRCSLRMHCRQPTK